MPVRRAVPAALALASALCAQGGSPCPPAGLVLAADGELLGGPYTIDLAGSPNVAGVLGFDFGGGPLDLVFGTICLDLSSAITLVNVALDGGGQLQLAGTLPNDVGLAGKSLFLQAVLVDLAQPGFLAISNGDVLHLGGPRFHLVAHDGPIVRFDSTLGQASLLGALSTAARGAVGVPALDAIAVLSDTGEVVLLDEGDASVLATVPVPVTTSPAYVALAGEHRLIVTEFGEPASPFSSGTPGTVHVVDLAAGTLVHSIGLSAVNATFPLVRPGTDLVYVRSMNTVVEIDHAAGVETRSATLPTGNGSISDWVLDGGRLVVLHHGIPVSPFGAGAPPGLNAIDLATFQPQYPVAAALPTTSVAFELRRGPGTTGTVLLALVSLPGEVFEVDPATLAVQGSVQVPDHTGDLEVSRGGTHWLLLRSGNPGFPSLPAATGALLSLDPATLSLTQVASLPSEHQQGLIVSSTGPLEAYAVTGGDGLLVIPTDPPAAPGAALPLPVSADPFLVVVD